MVLVAYVIQEVVSFALNFDPNAFWKILLLAFGSIAGELVVNLVTASIETEFYKKARNDLYSCAYEKIFSKDLDIHSEYDNNYYVSVFMNDIKTLSNEYFMKLNDSIAYAFLFVLSTVYLFFISPWIALIIIGSAFIIVGIPLFTGNTLQKSKMDSSKMMEIFTKKITDSIAFFTLIKLYKVENYDSKENTKAIADMTEAEKKFTRKSKYVDALTTVIGSLSVISTFVLGAYLVYKGTVIVGDLVASIQISSYIINSIVGFMTGLMGVISCKPIIKKINELLIKTNRDKPEKIDAEKPLDIKVENLEFNYKDKEESLFSNLSFEIKTGSKTLVQGPSGKGKSTLFKLLLGYYTNYKGNITYQGKEVTQIDNSLYDSCLLVPQDTILFNDTLRHNIVMGCIVSEDKLNEVIKLTHLTELVEKQEHGLDEMILDNGANFSGGEKQRINLARALIRNPKVLFLDESFSALDIDTENAIRSELFKRDITILEISHRENINYHYDNKIVLG